MKILGNDATARFDTAPARTGAAADRCASGHGSSGHLTGLATVEGHLKSGKLRALAFTSARRVPGAPEVPTLAESGYPGLEVLSWYGVLAPAGTPKDIVRKLNADINRILQAPDVRERLTALGTDPTGRTRLL